MHRGHKEVKGRFKKEGWFADFLHYKTYSSEAAKAPCAPAFLGGMSEDFKVIKQVQKLQKQLEIEKDKTH